MNHSSELSHHWMKKLQYLPTISLIHHLFWGIINNLPLWFIYFEAKHVTIARNSPQTEAHRYKKTKPNQRIILSGKELQVFRVTSFQRQLFRGQGLIPSPMRVRDTVLIQVPVYTSISNQALFLLYVFEKFKQNYYCFYISIQAFEYVISKMILIRINQINLIYWKIKCVYTYVYLKFSVDCHSK